MTRSSRAAPARRARPRRGDGRRGLVRHPEDRRHQGLGAVHASSCSSDSCSSPRPASRPRSFALATAVRRRTFAQITTYGFRAPTPAAEDRGRCAAPRGARGGDRREGARALRRPAAGGEGHRAMLRSSRACTRPRRRRSSAPDPGGVARPACAPAHERGQPRPRGRSSLWRCDVMGWYCRTFVVKRRAACARARSTSRCRSSSTCS